MKDHETEMWPLLFIYAKNGKFHLPASVNKNDIIMISDRLLSWRFVEEVARRQKSKGRYVLTAKFDRYILKGKLLIKLTIFISRSGKGGHVAHLKYHPEEYHQAVAQLLSHTF